jgi:6-pyruvoyltetrahydropterin/6-carboxytetrahydropterin synthase
MGTAFLTRTVAFSAAHRYYRPEWSEQENRRAFGACANPHGHGHNYVLAMTVAGEIDPQTGFSADLGMLDALLEDEVLCRFDHQHINYAIPEFAEGGLVPTSENLLAYLWPRLEQGLPTGVRLHCLRLQEDTRLFVDYFGGDAP